MKKHPWLRPLVVLMFVLHLTGCYSWQPVTVSPRQIVDEEEPGRIRIFQADGEAIELRNPRVEADSLAGRISTYDQTGTVRIALTDIIAVEVKRLSKPKTVVAGAALAVGVAVIVVWARLDRR